MDCSYKRCFNFYINLDDTDLFEIEDNDSNVIDDDTIVIDDSINEVSIYYLSNYLSNYLSTYSSICLSIYLTIYLSNYLSI